MTFDTPLLLGTLIRRYKRFLADVRLDDGTEITVHCPNTGRMTTCAEPGWRVALSDSRNPKRKYRHTWELVHNGTCWICVNTNRANEVAAEAVTAGLFPEWGTACLREKTFGNSRFDLLLENNGTRCYVEVKSVTLLADDGCYAFPDAVTQRGRKHLEELVKVVQTGYRAAMLFVVLRSDGSGFRAAHEIDPAYSNALTAAISAGVEVQVWPAAVSLEGIVLVEPITTSYLPTI